MIKYETGRNVRFQAWLFVATLIVSTIASVVGAYKYVTDKMDIRTLALFTDWLEDLARTNFLPGAKITQGEAFAYLARVRSSPYYHHLFQDSFDLIFIQAPIASAVLSGIIFIIIWSIKNYFQQTKIGGK